MRMPRVGSVALGVMVFGILLSAFRPASGVKRRTTGAQSKTTAYRNTLPEVGYVGSSLCAGCHKNIYDQYIQTDMGRSMSLASEPSQLQKVSAPITIFSKKLNRYFRVFREGTDLHQSHYELDSNGKDVFRTTHQIEYVIGAGSNGFGYVVRRGDYLFQAPLSYYPRAGKWDLSPGYEFNDYGFSRPIQAACIVCHSGQPQPVAQRYGLYRDPPFRELAIGCENCHGPGQLHVRERLKGLPSPEAGDRTIVNPARLPTWMADNICMNCHQDGNARILQPGKDYVDFRPGTPLNDTLVIFKVPPRRGSPAVSDLLEHYYLMTLGKCYSGSGGRLSCLSCHNPHVQPSPLEAPAYFRSKCLACHSKQSCALPLPKRLRQDSPNDCAGCHLPKRDLETISHSILTNHRIIAHRGQPYPEIAFRQSSSALPDLIHVNAVPGKESAEIPPLTLLQAYGELMDSHPNYGERYLSLLDQLARTEADNPLVLSALAGKARLEGRPEGSAAALQYLSRAIELGSTSSSDYQDLAELLARSGQVSEAIEVLKQGIAMAPYTPVFYQSLAQRYVELKQYPQALATMKRQLQLFPHDSTMRKLIQQVVQPGR